MVRTRASVSKHAFLLLLFSSTIHGAPVAYRIDAARSRLEATTTKAGLLSRFGHTHGVLAHDFTGSVKLEPEHLEHSSVELEVDATTLEILPGELGEGDHAKVQANMEGADILDVKKFTSITFASKKVALEGEEGPVHRLRIDVEMTMHGSSQTVIMPVEVKFGDRTLDARGEFSVLQTDFGIRPFSAMLGSIKVGDEVKFRYVIHAERDTGPESLAAP